MEGVSMGSGAGQVAAAAAEGARLNGVSTSGSGSASGSQDPSTAPQFGDVLKKIQSQYGAKAEKPREIKKTLGKDDFLKIMITQMRHQDPTNPFKAEQMAQEMAQFTSVEQLQNMNQSLTKMTQQQNPLERLAMTNLIGKTVTIDRDRFNHTENSNSTVAYSLPRDAKEVKLVLISDTGETVLEKDLGAQKMGENVFAWDGLKGNRLPAKGGNYMVRIEAKDEKGSSIQTDSQQKARVVGVSFQGSEPVLLVGDSRNQAKITMKNVVQIDGDAFAASAGAPAAAAAPGSSAESPKGSNFISFQKGVGSSNLDTSRIAPEVADAIAKFHQGDQQTVAAAPTNPTASAASNAAKNAMEAAKRQISTGQGPAEEKGFPNGLSGN